MNMYRFDTDEDSKELQLPVAARLHIISC